MAFEFLVMDLPSYMVGAGICIGIFLIVYLISVFSIKEKSFEEVIEEQKKRSKEEELQQKLERSKRDKDKKFKKWGKKKEKADHSGDGLKEPEKEEMISAYHQQTGENVPEIEIIEPKEVKSKKKPKVAVKSANKPDSSLSSEEVELSELQTKVSTDVKAEVEHKKPEKMLKEKDKQRKDAKDEEVKNIKAVDIENMNSSSSSAIQPSHTSPAIQPSHTSPPAKKKKKDHSEKGTDAYLNITTDKLISFLKEAELGDEDSQLLIDVLLNKQKVVMGWTKQKDPLAAVKKQLQEKEQAFELELRQNHAVTAKLKELKQEYAQEKNKVSALERVLLERTNTQNAEIKALTSRIKEAQEQLNSEKIASQDKLQQLQKSSEERLEATIKKYQEEKVLLKEALSKLEASSRSHSKADYEAKIESLQKSRDDLQKVHNLLVDQHTTLHSSHQSDLEKVKRQLFDVTKLLKEANDNEICLAQEVESLKKTCESLKTSKLALENQVRNLETNALPKTEVELLKSSLEESKKKCCDLETQVEHLSSHTKELMQLNNSQQAHIENLKQENERLSSDLASITDRMAGDGQEIVQHNGDLEMKENKYQQSMNEKEILLQEKEKLVNQLHEYIDKQKAEITILTDELETQKQKNNELREKNWKAVEAMSAAEKSAEQKMQEIQKLAEEKIAKVQIEAEMQLKGSEESSLESSCKVTEKLRLAEEKFSNFQVEAEERLHACQNEASEKVKHLSFELQRVENLQKTTENRISEIQLNAEGLESEILKTQSSTKSCLQRIFPNIRVDSSTPYDVWLVKFEEQAVDVMQTSLTDACEVEHLLSKMTDLQKEKEELSKAAQQYKTILADTEDDLKQLQGSVETEQLVWEKKLSVKEKELEQALQEKENLTSEIERLQSVVQQMGKLDEMQENLKLLQNTIETSESERAHLELKYEEVNKNYLNIQDQVKIKNERILELQKELKVATDSQKELEDVKLKLEKEKKINKDLSAQTVKLNSLVKIGQDSLKVEQDTVLQLKNQLEAQKSSTANGTSNQTPSVDLCEDTNIKK